MSSSSAVVPAATPQPCTAALAGLNIAVVEKDEGRWHLPAPGLHPGQGVPGDGDGLPHRRRRQGVRDRHRSALGRLRPVARPASRRSSTSCGGASRAHEEAQDHRRCRDRHARPRSPGQGQTTAAELVGGSVILASGSVPRTIPGFEIDGKIVLMTSDEVLALERLPTSAVVIGGGAIGCEFASMMSDLGTPGHHPRGPPEDPARVRQGRRRCGAALVQEAGHRRAHRRQGHRPHAQQRRHRHDCASAATSEDIAVEAVVMSVGRRPLSDGLVCRRHRRRGRQARLRGGGRVHAHRRGGRLRGRRPGGHARPGPRRLRRGVSWSSTRSWASPWSPSTTPRCPGASTATPRWPSPAIPRRRPGRPASRW